MPRATVYWLLAPPAAAGAGLLLAVQPLVLLSLAVAIIAAFALTRAGGRLIGVTAGGLLILQGSQGLNPPKLAYFAFILVSWVIAIAHLTAPTDTHTWTGPFRRLLIGTYLLLGLVLISAPIALTNGVQLTDWARDALPYALLAMLPLIGVDCARDVTSRFILFLFASAGTVAALGYGIDWLSLRGVSSVGVTQFTLSSGALVAAVFSFAIVRGATGPNRPRWLALATFALVCYLLSGSRSGLVLLAGFLGIAGTSRKLRVPIRSVIGLLAALSLVTATLIPLAGSLLVNDPTFLSQRAASVVSFLQNGSTDPSYSARVVEYSQAATSIAAHPLFGTGPGFLYTNTDPAAPPVFTLDTPLVTPAKFGLLGSGIIVFWLAQLASTIRATRRLVGATQVSTALRAFGLIFVLDLPFGGFLEDKGFSIALMLLLGLLAATGRERLSDMHARETDQGRGRPTLAAAKGNVAYSSAQPSA
jgi:hypothetical protein